jgi:DNA-binding MarR family transcriptional regulator
VGSIPTLGSHTHVSRLRLRVPIAVACTLDLLMKPTVDLRQPEMRELALRIGASWVQIRRGAAMGTLREYLLGTGDEALEQGQMDSLDLLARKPSWRMSDLAEALRIDPSTATRAVQRLVSSGLAVRCGHDDDGRVVMVSVTEAGRSRHAAVNARRGELMAHMLGAFTAEERPVLADILERFVSAIDEFVVDLAERSAPVAP